MTKTKARRIKDNDRTSHDIERAYGERKYIVAYKTVYQPFYSPNAGYYAHEVYRSRQQLPLTPRGRFCHYTGEQVNRLIGINLLRNL